MLEAPADGGVKFRSCLNACGREFQITDNGWGGDEETKVRRESVADQFAKRGL